MENFTVFDGGVAAILFISAVLAYSRGFVREVLSIAGWIGAGAVAFYLAPQVVPLVQEIPILNEIIGENCELGVLSAFAGVFAIALVIIALFTPLISGAVQKSALSSLDGGLGFLFGIIRGVLLIIVVLISYDFFIAGGEGFPVIEDSKTRVILAEQQESLKNYVPTGIPEWLVEPYSTLMLSCTGKTIDEA